MNPEELSEARSEVVEKFINVEWIINAVISQCYLGRPSRDFILEVLYDPSFSFGLKRNILQKIPGIDRHKIDELNRLSNIRNYFAHVSQDIQDVTEVVPDPKSPHKSLDFDALYEEFLKIEPGITEYLFEFYTQLGGVSYDKPPKSSA